MSSEETPLDLRAFARKVFERQPFTRYIGATLEDSGASTAVISIEVADHHLQQHGFVHGGVLSYLADNAITFAGGLAMKGNALTSEFKVNYVRPARGSKVIARASARNAGKRQAVCQCEIFVLADGEEKLCALAQGTVVAAADP